MASLVKIETVGRRAVIERRGWQKYFRRIRRLFSCATWVMTNTARKSIRVQGPRRITMAAVLSRVNRLLRGRTNPVREDLDDDGNHLGWYRNEADGDVVRFTDLEFVDWARRLRVLKAHEVIIPCPGIDPAVARPLLRLVA